MFLRDCKQWCVVDDCPVEMTLQHATNTRGRSQAIMNNPRASEVYDWYESLHA